MSRSILYLGMDVHEESVTIAVLPADAAAPTRMERPAVNPSTSTKTSTSP